jgi:hypothetical protein
MPQQSKEKVLLKYKISIYKHINVLSNENSGKSKRHPPSSTTRFTGKTITEKIRITNSIGVKFNE